MHILIFFKKNLGKKGYIIHGKNKVLLPNALKIKWCEACEGSS